MGNRRQMGQMGLHNGNRNRFGDEHLGNGNGGDNNGRRNRRRRRRDFEEALHDRVSLMSFVLNYCTLV